MSAASGNDAEVKELLANVEAPDNLKSPQPKATETDETSQSSGKELDTTPVQLSELKKLDQLVRVITIDPYNTEKRRLFQFLSVQCGRVVTAEPEKPVKNLFCSILLF